MVFAGVCFFYISKYFTLKKKASVGFTRNDTKQKFIITFVILQGLLGYKSDFQREVKDFRKNASARVCSKRKWNRKCK